VPSYGQAGHKAQRPGLVELGSWRRRWDSQAEPGTLIRALSRMAPLAGAFVANISVPGNDSGSGAGTRGQASSRM